MYSAIDSAGGGRGGAGAVDLSMWRAMAGAGDEGEEGGARAEPETVASTPAPPEAPPAAAAEWTCAICTYINKFVARAYVPDGEPGTRAQALQLARRQGAVVGQAEEARADAVKVVGGDHAPPSGAL